MAGNWDPFGSKWSWKGNGKRADGGKGEKGNEKSGDPYYYHHYVYEWGVNGCRSFSYLKLLKMLGTIRQGRIAWSFETCWNLLPSCHFSRRNGTLNNTHHSFLLSWLWRGTTWTNTTGLHGTVMKMSKGRGLATKSSRSFFLFSNDSSFSAF